MQPQYSQGWYHGSQKEDNWVARWCLYHSFRYTDRRNRTLYRDVGSGPYITSKARDEINNSLQLQHKLSEQDEMQYVAVKIDSFSVIRGIRPAESLHSSSALGEVVGPVTESSVEHSALGTWDRSSYFPRNEEYPEGSDELLEDTIIVDSANIDCE